MTGCVLCLNLCEMRPPCVVRPAAPASDLRLPSIVRAAPSSARSAAGVFFLLAFEAVPDAPIGSLQLERAGEFAMRASSLRLDPSSDAAVQRRTAVELLRYAVLNEECLRNGGALVASAESDPDAVLLESIGFLPTGVHSSQLDAGAVEPGSPPPSDAPLLAWRERHAADEADGRLNGCGHVALRCSNLELSLEFWTLFDFRRDLSFSTSGARATCISAPWTSLALELLEVPAPLLAESPPPSSVQLGLSHVCLDVTAISVDLQQTLRMLQERSQAKFGRTLRVLIAPHQQMLGRLVVEAVVVRAPDGMQLRLMRRMTVLAQDLEEDWKLGTSATAEE